MNCFYWIFAKSKQTSFIRFTEDVSRVPSMVMEKKIEAVKAAHVKTLVDTENSVHHD